ncbi:MAG TPA: DNA polymerase III subunit alpha, partial [Sorangium sp.]|nr:DNA polymerase III subunit alpha [Sorangium sp.]
RIFALLEFFAGYGFNKSHSAAYALITYQTAYLKAHFPVEFLCALLTADRDKTDKVVRIIAEGRAWGVEILPPEINQSNVDFTVVYSDPAEVLAARKKAKAADSAAPSRARRRIRDPLMPKIRFGLGAVRGVGESALEALLEARAAGPFDDLFDVATRVDVKRLNRGVLEALTQCGAFDEALKKRGISRARAYSSVDRVIERGRSASRDRANGQTNLFGLFQQQSTPQATTSLDYVDRQPWDQRETLRREKESLGFYVSGHPLDRYGIDLRRFDVAAAHSLAAMSPWSRVRVAGTVEGYRERTFRSGGKLAFFVLEDLSGGIEAKARERQLNQYGDIITSGEPVLISGKLQFPMQDDDDSDSERQPTLLVDEVVLLSEVIAAETRSVSLRLTVEQAPREVLVQLAEVLRATPGRCPVQLVLTMPTGAEAVLSLGGLRVAPNDALLSALERLFGRNVAELR